MAAVCWALLLCAAAERLQFVRSTYGVPGPGKIFRDGHDRELTTRHLLLLADGAGSWELRGVNPGEFAQSLLRKFRYYFRQDPRAHINNLAQLLGYAAQRVRVEGTATCVIIALERESPRAHVLSLGDSSYLHLRKNAEKQYEVIGRGQPKESAPNTPLQIGRNYPNAPLADLGSFPVQLGDKLLVASDGLFDNLYDADIVALLNASVRGTGDEFVRALVELAVAASFARNYYSPFARRMLAAGVPNVQISGKVDDITVIFASVERA